MKKSTLLALKTFIEAEENLVLNKSKRAKDADRLIDQLYAELLKIFERDEPILILKQKYGQLIHQKILGFAQRAWFIGVSYVRKQTRKNVVVTPQDLLLIEREAQRIEDRFWKLLSQRQSKIISEFTDPQISNFLNFQASEIIVRLLNMATVNYVRSIYGDNLNPDVWFVWETEQDDKVCPICFPLQGRIFRQSSEIIRPVDDTHIGCRCMLAVIDRTSGQAI